MMIDGQLRPTITGVCWSMSHDDVACDITGTVIRYRGTLGKWKGRREGAGDDGKRYGSSVREAHFKRYNNLGFVI
jgi:hypothetical protein